MKNTLIAGAAAMTAACLLTACGGDSGTTVKKVEPKPPSTQKVKSPEEAMADGLKSGSGDARTTPGADKPK